jgi:hypothetical protein
MVWSPSPTPSPARGEGIIVLFSKKSFMTERHPRTMKMLRVFRLRLRLGSPFGLTLEGYEILKTNNSVSSRNDIT